MNKSMLKNTFRSIKYTFSRFISIVLIVAVGLAFFAGIKASSPDMKLTAEQYFYRSNLFDLKVQSSIGLTNADINAIAAVEGVEYVMPGKFIDALVWVNDKIEADIDGTQISTRAYGIDLEFLADKAAGIYDGSFINQPQLIDGRFPTAANECLVDASRLSTPDSYQIGSTIRLEGDGDSIFATLNINEFKIVGIIRSPLYVSFERGNSLVGSGKIGTFIYIPNEAFDTDYYTEIYVTVKDADKFSSFSAAYLEHVNAVGENISAISQARLSSRATQLNASLPPQISQATTTLNIKTQQADSAFAEAKAQVEQLKQLVENGDEILAAAQKEYNSKFSQAQQILLNNQTDYNEKVAAYNSQHAIVEESQRVYDTQFALFQEQESQANAALSTLKTSEAQLTAAQNTITTTESLITTVQTVLTSLEAVQTQALNQEQLQGIIGVLEGAYPELYKSIINLTAQGTATSAINLINPILIQKKAELAQAQIELDTQKISYERYLNEYNSAKALLDSARATLDAKKTELETAKLALQTAYQQLISYGNSISDGKTTITMEQIQAQQQLYALQMQVENAPASYAAAEKKLNDAMGEVNREILKAKTQIKNATSLLGKISEAKWTISDRTVSPGYESFCSTIDNIAVLANIFPVFFIIVAALVCLTTMTRMVADERVQMGTLKALGYDDKAIISKYIIYALIAAFLGTALGVSIGLYAFPHAISAAYGIMYDMPPLQITFPIMTVIISILIAVASTVLAAYIASRRELDGKPAILMRPKAPRPGKRVLLERVGFIWKRLNFTTKVTFRNTFRNAQRFVMTIFGIAGCTALLLAGAGMNDSVAAIITKQYNERAISKYDFQIVFSENQSENSPALSAVIADERTDSAMLTAMSSVTAHAEGDDFLMDVYTLVPQKPEEMKSYIDLRTRKSARTISLNDKGAVITEKLAKKTGVGVGDSIVIRTADDKEYSVIVADIAENYTFHYIYMTPTVYTAVFGKTPDYAYALGNLTEEVRNASATAVDGIATDKSMLATDLMKNVHINAVAYTTDSMEMLSEITNALSLVVLVFIISAAILAIVVLYNLSNINIQERIREVATIKVLGFYDKEVSSYIFRENIILTVIGAAIGLVIGIGLHALIINFAEIDTVMFGRDIAPLSFLLAVLATFIFAAIVNIIMHKKLKKISMTASFITAE